MTETLEPIERLHKDVLAAASQNLDRREARYLVDLYYAVQDFRIQAQSQVRAAVEGHEPHAVVRWGFDAFDRIEGEIKKALGRFADAAPDGQWLLSVHGIGPVIAAGLMAYIDIEQAPTAGRIWRLAGLDPSVEWIGRDGAAAVVRELVAGKEPTLDELAAVALRTKRSPERLVRAAADPETGKLTTARLTSFLARRPWNARLKVLCWKIGDSFVKQSGSPKCFYGRLYLERKAYEIARNESGGNAETARATLAKKKIGEPTTRAAYEAGKLPAGRIDLRARRWAVKLFLAHYQAVAWEARFGTPPPKPYAISHLGHADEIPVPRTTTGESTVSIE